MQTLFFYGTLRDADVLAMVLGPEHAALTVGVLENHVAMAVAGETFPIIHTKKGAQAHGLLAENLSNEAVARLNYFELGFGYELRTCPVNANGRVVDAQVYFCPPALFETDGEWDFAAWETRQKPLFLEAGAEFMAQYGRIPADKLEPFWAGMRNRALARIAGRATVAPASLRKNHANEVETITMQRPYLGFFAIEEFELRHRKFSGEASAPMRRAVFASGDAVTVLPYDALGDTVLLIEQFRAGPFARQDPNPWCLEAIAGRIDTDESPEDAARREAGEEAGLVLGEMERMFGYYTSPGAVAEYITSFVAKANLGDAGGVFGLASEHEDIRAIVVPFDVAHATIASGEANNAPLLLSLQWLAVHRARLRKLWGGVA
ncbi:MAG: NUDIX domain-containing protein [Paracoccaceae bacterium]